MYKRMVKLVENIDCVMHCWDIYIAVHIKDGFLTDNIYLPVYYDTHSNELILQSVSDMYIGEIPTIVIGLDKFLQLGDVKFHTEVWYNRFGGKNMIRGLGFGRLRTFCKRYSIRPYLDPYDHSDYSDMSDSDDSDDE